MKLIINSGPLTFQVRQYKHVSADIISHMVASYPDEGDDAGGASRWRPEDADREQVTHDLITNQ